MFYPFKKNKPNVCFFCPSKLTKETEFNIQYTSADGVHTEKVCPECSKVFDELYDLIEESKNDGRY